MISNRFIFVCYNLNYSPLFTSASQFYFTVIFVCKCRIILLEPMKNNKNQRISGLPKPLFTNGLNGLNFNTKTMC